MQIELPSDVVAFGDAVRSRLTALGGVRFALDAESDPDARSVAGAALAEVGAWDVDPRAGADELLAAAQLCRVAGAVVLPYPVVEQLLAVDAARLALVDVRRPWVDHGDLPGEWLASDLDGSTRRVRAEPIGRSLLAPFVTPVTLGEPGSRIPLDDVGRHLVLGAWRVLGGLEAALDLASAHVAVRKQFGQPLAEFQAVRFAVADATVAVRGLEELAKFTVWRLDTAATAARFADALALRVHACDVATTVMHACHQLLGAIGFCDEHDVSVIDRHLQSVLRLPMPAESLADRLSRDVSMGALEGLFTATA